MSEQITYAYAGDIDKSYDEDGSLIVVGKATGPDLDLDEQVCDPNWLREAMPAWMKFGNLREMHQPVAAGVGLELSAEGDDWHLRSKVVDPGTQAKIEAGALRGYSIGIKGAKVIKDAAAPGGRIVGGTIVEVSYVDRPCNPTAVTAIAKGAGLTEAVEASEAERTYDLDKSNAMNADANIGAEWQPEDTYQDDADGAAERQKDGEYPTDHLCRKCDGLGKLPETGEECPHCEGTGRVDEKPEQAGKPASYSPDEEPEKDAEPDAVKREFSEAERASAEQSGAAMPGGAFPIKTVADLKNAIQSIGRAKDPAAAKAHIKSRAAALGRDDLIPDNWKGADADLDKVEHDPAALNAVRNALIALIKAELDEMVAGEEDETCDVSHLMAALSIFLQWWDGEAAEGETAAPFTTDDDKEPEMDLTYLGVSADLIKSVGAGEAEPDAIKIDLIKALGIEDLREDVQTVKAAQQEELDLLKAELERIKTLAAPGGPAITRTQAQAHKSAEAERLASEASRYYSIAEQVEDLSLAKMYREKADAMSRDASKIANA
jgi:hypothetical protein